MITQEQRDTRRKYLGSSDAAAVLGLDPYKSAADVFLDKTGQTEDFEGNEATERGNLLEPVLLDWAERKIGRKFNRDVMVIHASEMLATNFDGLQMEGESFIVEAKTSVLGDEWGDEGTDQVPERVLVQTHHQFLHAPGVKVAYIPVLLPGFKSFDWRMFQVHRNEDLASIVEGKGIEFMEKFVRTGTRPGDFKPTLEVLKRVRREPNKTISIPPELFHRLIIARDKKKAANQYSEKVDAEVLAFIGDAECAECDEGKLTYFEIQRRGYVVEPSSYRQLRATPAKKGK